MEKVWGMFKNHHELFLLVVQPLHYLKDQCLGKSLVFGAIPALSGVIRLGNLPIGHLLSLVVALLPLV